MYRIYIEEMSYLVYMSYAVLYLSFTEKTLHI